MTTTLIFILIGMDLILLAAVYFLNRKRIDATHLLKELTEERQYISDLRSNIQEDLANAAAKNKETLSKVNKVAVEIEQELKTGGDTIHTELEKITGQLSEQFEGPLAELSKKQTMLEAIIRKAEKNRELLLKAITRGENICRFFEKNVHYEDVLADLQEKKYSDARQMLAKGHKPDFIARELGLNISEVKLIAGLT